MKPIVRINLFIDCCGKRLLFVRYWEFDKLPRRRDRVSVPDHTEAGWWEVQIEDIIYNPTHLRVDIELELFATPPDVTPDATIAHYKKRGWKELTDDDRG